MSKRKISVLIVFGAILVLLSVSPIFQSNAPFNYPVFAATNVTHHTFFSTYMGNQQWGYNIYLPPGYDTGSARYPVIYMLHGSGDDENRMVFMADYLHNAIINKQVPPTIMVFPNGGKDTFYCDYNVWPNSEGYNADSYIIKEFIPYIDNNYRTLNSRPYRVIQGFSMGGWGSLHFAFKYPNLFSRVCALSPGGRNVNAENNPYNLATTNADILRSSTKIRLVVGSIDSLKPGVDQMDSLLTSLKIAHEYEIVPNVAHNPEGIYSVSGLRDLQFLTAGFAQPTPSPTPTPTITPTPSPSPTPTPTPTITSTPTPVNLALNKPVTYSSQQTGNEASHINDGDIASRWSASPFPQWIRIDLGATYSINKTEVLPYSSRAYQYKIDVSTDGSNFTQVVDRTGNTNGSSLLTDSFNPINARYVRLTVTNCYNYTGTWISINEIHVFGGPPTITPTPSPTPTPTPTITPTPIPVNLALNKPVTYSNGQTGNEASHINDGDSASRWSASPFPQWVQTDLGTTYSITKTEVLPYLNRAYQYKIEVSTDGSNFTQVVDRTGNTDGSSLLTDNFNAVNARYVRLTVTGCYNYTGTWISINEFHVYGGLPIGPTP